MAVKVVCAASTMLPGVVVDSDCVVIAVEYADEIAELKIVVDCDVGVPEI